MLPPGVGPPFTVAVATNVYGTLRGQTGGQLVSLNGADLHARYSPGDVTLVANRAPVGLSAGGPYVITAGDGLSVSATAKSGVDIQPAVTWLEHFDRLAAENGDVLFANRIHALAPGGVRPEFWKVDANEPIAPQISRFRRAFRLEKRLGQSGQPLSKCLGDARLPVPRDPDCSPLVPDGICWAAMGFQA